MEVGWRPFRYSTLDGVNLSLHDHCPGVLGAVKVEPRPKAAAVASRTLTARCARLGWVGLRRELGEEARMKMRIYQVAIEVARMMVPVLEEIERRDRDLARQARRAVPSVASTSQRRVGVRVGIGGRATSMRRDPRGRSAPVSRWPRRWGT